MVNGDRGASTAPSEESNTQALSDRLAAAEAAYDALVRRYSSDLSSADIARQRFAMILAQAVNYDRLESIARPPSSLGDRIGAVVDLLAYGAAYAAGLKRTQAAGRLKLALLNHLPGLLAFIQRRRNRPFVDPNRRDLLFSAYDTITSPTGDTIELPNLFNRRSTREKMRSLCMRLLAATDTYGPVSSIYALNFHAGGGAESVTLSYVRVAAEAEGVVVLIMTDNGPRTAIPRLPSNVVVLDFGHDESFDQESRMAMLFLLWQASGSERVHIVNSEVAWRLVLKTPATLLPPSVIFASIFALQFDDAGLPVGYAASFLPLATNRLTALLTDNERFALEGPGAVGASMAPDRIVAAPSPCRLEARVSMTEALEGVQDRTQKGAARLTVLWAGRLDVEKRIDLLFEIARRTTDRFDFIVYGRSVLGGHNWDARLQALPNVKMMGGYSDPLEWVRGELQPSAFLFTSVWEGMPNTLVEAAWLGLPTVATDVGGVRDLLDTMTGWPIDRSSAAEDYINALNEIRNRPEEARVRTIRLVERVHSRHTATAFETSVRTAYNMQPVSGPENL